MMVNCLFVMRIPELFRSAMPALLLLVPGWQFHAGAATGRIDVRDAFFNKPVIRRISIELDEEALKALGEAPRKYVRAVVKEGGSVYTDIGVHLKGALGSYQPIEKKPSLTLNFDKFVRG